MKKIAIVLFAAIALTSCGGSSEKCEATCTDSTAVVSPVDTVAPAADTTQVDTAATK